MSPVVPTGQVRTAVPIPAKLLRDSFFEYSATIAFTALLQTTVAIPIQSDADFICVASMFEISTHAGVDIGTVVNGGSLVQLTDTAGNRFLSNVPVPTSCLFGTAREPFIWPFTHCFKANGALVINATDTTGGVQTTRWVFAGYKIPRGTLEA